MVPAIPSRVPSALERDGFFDDHVFHRHIVVIALARGLYGPDLVDHIGAAYNLAKQFHPKSNNWLGFVIEIAGKRIYYAGDTDATDEMKALKNIDLALLPAGGKYTMNADEAADATKQFKPKQAIPYHWGDIVGSQADADNFKKLAACKVTVLKPGESITVD